MWQILNDIYINVEIIFFLKKKRILCFNKIKKTSRYLHRQYFHVYMECLQDINLKDNDIKMYLQVTDKPNLVI